MIYLDHAATTPLHPLVRQAVAEAEAVFGNPSSLHAEGRRARTLLEDSRTAVAAAVGAPPASVIFTASGTEANHLALRGMVGAMPAGVPVHLVISAIEHPCVRSAAHDLVETRPGTSLSECPVDRDGLVRPDDLAPLLRPETRLVSIMAVNNELGTIQPVGALGALCRARGIPFHIDACQAPGRLDISRLFEHADLITLCAHKVYGPRGAAALIVRDDIVLRPMLRGGHQERERRAGTENVPACAGFARALQLASAHLSEWSAHARECERALAAALTGAGVPFSETVPGSCRVAGIWNLALGDLAAEEVLIALDLEGIAISTGSACNSGSIRPSHVLGALGLDAAEARRRVRLSAGLATDPQQMPAVAEALRRLLDRKQAG